MYTPEELEAVALRLAGGSASAQDEVIGADAIRAHAALLRAQLRVLSENNRIARTRSRGFDGDDE